MQVLDFCFPEGVEHPKAAARLFLLCEYGPLQDGWLWGGPHNARRKLTPYEIETMVTKLEREDIIKSVAPVEHGRSSMLPPTPEEENEVLAGIPESIKKPYRLRVPHIVAMLANCSTEPWEEPVEPEPDARIAVVDAYVLAFGAAVPPAEGAGNEEGAVGWLTDLNAPAAEGEEPAPGPAVEELVATIAAQLAPSTAEGQEAVRPPGLSEEACGAAAPPFPHPPPSVPTPVPEVTHVRLPPPGNPALIRRARVCAVFAQRRSTRSSWTVRSSRRPSWRSCLAPRTRRALHG